MVREGEKTGKTKAMCPQTVSSIHRNQAELEAPASVDSDWVELCFYRRLGSAVWGRGRLRVGAGPPFNQTNNASVCFLYWGSGGDFILKRSSAKNKMAIKSLNK